MTVPFPTQPAPDPLPAPPTSFVGRDRDLAIVTGLLSRPGIRLVTITGPGGVGKTRLALRAAGKARDAFDDVAFVPLATARDPAMLLSTIADNLTVPDAPGQPLPDRLRASIADRRLLLALDNLEHLLDAAPAIADLLARSPGLTILATSRATLNLSGEHLLPLAPLDRDEARALFVDRVRALQPSFAPSHDNAPVIDAICGRLDRLPLAIELAASRVPALPLTALLARLDHRLNLLAGGPRDTPPRLRDMRVAIGWSQDLLSDDHQRLFRRLGVFIGGFTLEAAEVVADGEVDTLDGITALVAASLIVPIEGIADEPRYTMLETIREFALERLAASGEEPETRARHAAYYCQLAEATLPLYDGPDLRLATDRIDIELDNCRAAMTWALETGNAETGTRLAGASALAHLRGELDRAQALGDTLLARALGYPYGAFWAHIVLGMTAEARSDLDTARHHYAEGLAIAPAARNPQNHQALAHGALGSLAQRAGDLTEAQRHLEEAFRLSEITGNVWSVAQSSRRLGQVVRDRGDVGRAAMLVRTSLMAHMSQRDVCGVHATLTDGARLALAIGQPERAARLLGAASAFPHHPSEADAFNRATTDAQAGISGAAFAAASATGRLLAWNAVVAEVDTLIDAAASTPPATPPDPASQYHLSRREIEVLRHLAEGHTNRVIARSLSVSERTVENHVSHILAKLDVASRSAAATWAVRHDLV